MNLIDATEARKNAESFDLTAAQVLDEIAFSIEASSKQGKREIICSFLKSAVSDQEMEVVLSTLIGKGFNVSFPVSSNLHEVYIKVEY